MPRHQQVTTCRKSGGPISKFCSCEHCTLGVCSVCGAYEGSLTTDCPGEGVSFDRQKEVYETNLDYTEDRGWHQGEPEARRTPHFEPQAPPAHAARLALSRPDGVTQLARIVGCTCGWQTPPNANNPDDDFARHIGAVSIALHVGTAPISPSIDWVAIDRTAALKDDLTKKAIAWVLADRVADQHSADLTRLEDEADAYLVPRKEQPPDARARELLEKLEHAKPGFKIADQRAVACDDEFRQAARKLVEALEQEPLTAHDKSERKPMTQKMAVPVTFYVPDGTSNRFEAFSTSTLIEALVGTHPTFKVRPEHRQAFNDDLRAEIDRRIPSRKAE